MEDLPIGSEIVLKVVKTEKEQCNGCFFDEICNNIYENVCGDFDCDSNIYRIKPGPKYRPFKDAKECRSEMLKHQPFGWLISQNGEVNSLIIFIDNEGIVIGDRNNGVIGFATATDLFKIKFADGTPFGVKVEE